VADKYSYVMYRHSSGHRWIGLFVGLALLCAQSKFSGGSYDGGGWVQVSCPPVVLVSAKFQGGPYDGESMASLTCPPVVLTSNKFQGGPYDGESMASLTCPPIILTSNKFQGGPYDGESMASLTCPPIILTSNKFQGGPYDGESMASLTCPPIILTSNKFQGGPYDGESMASLTCPPVVLVSVKFQGGPYDGESMASLTCPPVVLTSNKFQGGPYDGESMASFACPPIILVSNKFQGGPYDGESMASFACPPIILVSNKFQGGPYDGESMGMLSNPCGPPLGISGEIVLMGRWLQPGEALLTWSFSQDPEVMLYVLSRQAAGSSVWATVETTLPIEAPDHPYEVIDRGLAPGSYLYRVEVVMKNGSVRYSNAVELGYVESPEPEIVAYPNPTRDAFHLRVYLPYESEVVIEGWDMTGQRVMMEQYFHRKGQALYTVSMRGFAQGLYSFRLQALSVGESWNFHVLKVD